MNTLARLLAAAVLTGPVAQPLAGQSPTGGLVTRTISLRYLRAEDAARLVSPYVRAANGGVYDAGAVHAVTIVESAPVIARIDSLIRANDRAPATVVLRFLLIAADDTPGRDAAIDSIDTMLRGLFRYRGYHLLGQGTATAGEAEAFSITMAGGDDRYALGGEVLAVELPGSEPVIVVDGVRQPSQRGAVRVRVRLGRVGGGTFEGKPNSPDPLLSTGLTVPIGQTVVLGSAAPGGESKAIILALRPEVDRR